MQYDIMKNSYMELISDLPILQNDYEPKAENYLAMLPQMKQYEDFTKMIKKGKFNPPQLHDSNPRMS